MHRTESRLISDCVEIVPTDIPEEVTETDHHLFKETVSTRISAEQEARVVRPIRTFSRQRKVLAIHWHPEFVPMEMIEKRIQGPYLSIRTKPGDKIPSEREMTEQLGVSRISVRNAISKLVVLGFLENKQGQGTFVCKTNGLRKNPLALALGAADSTIKDLLEVRMGLKCNATALAAERADEEDINILEDCIKQIHDEVLLGRLGAEADVSFHMAVAYATKNPAQVHIMKNFYDFLYLGIEKNLLHLYEEPIQIETIRKQHIKIVDAIRNRDPEKAFNAMKLHVMHVIDFFDD